MIRIAKEICIKFLCLNAFFILTAKIVIKTKKPIKPSSAKF